MALLTTIFTGLKMIGIGGGWIRNMRKDSLDYKLQASQTDNEKEKNRLEYKAKAIDMEIEDYQNARGAAASLPYGIVWCMTAAAALAVLYLAIGIFRPQYAYAEFNQLDPHIAKIVDNIFKFMFGGAAAIAASSVFRK